MGVCASKTVAGKMLAAIGHAALQQALHEAAESEADRIVSEAALIYWMLDRAKGAEANMLRRFCWRLGIAAQGLDRDAAIIGAAEQVMREERIGPDMFFYRHRGGRAAQGALAAALEGYQACDGTHEYWTDGQPEAMLIDEVESRNNPNYDECCLTRLNVLTRVISKK